MSYSWVLLDADNTLFDFHASERDGLRRAMADFALPFNEEHHALYLQINKACWTAYEHGDLTKAQLRRERFARFFDAIGTRGDAESFGRSYLDYLSQGIHLMEDTIAVLDHLKDKHRLALITNGLKEVQWPRLRKSGIQDYFEVIVVSDEIGVAKPDAGFFDHTFTQMGPTDLDEVLVVGDNLNADVKGAMDYGLSACWMNPEGKTPHLNIEPTYQIRRLNELLPILGH